MRPVYTPLYALAALQLMIGVVYGAYTLQFCSNQNTGSDDSQGVGLWNSYLTCTGNCTGYAYGILQYQSCWCSNYAPSRQDSLSSCNLGCPGYPDDNCGNVNEGLFAYLALGPTASGTVGGGGSGTTATSQYSPSNSPSPSSTPFASTTSSNYPSSATGSTSSRQSITTPRTTVQTMTSSGSPVTRTVTIAPSGTLGSSSQGSSKSHGLSSGATAGIVIGVLAAVAALVLLGFLLWRRRRRSDDPAEAGEPKPKRTTSVLSRTGLLARGGRQSMMEHSFEEGAFGGNLSHSIRHSMLYGAGTATESVDPSSPLGSSHDNHSARRPSKPLVYDQRLNPSALFANHDNGSRVSMQDNNDYSRPLGIANPDPRPSHESRRSNWD